MKKFLPFSLLLSAFTAVATAATLTEQTAQLCKNGDYPAIVELARPLAEQGNPEAQSILGLCYGCGLGAEFDCATAFNWYLKAAENGHPESQYALGVNYLQGNGVEQNSEAALKWLELAADSGSMWAALKIAEYYDEHGNLKEAEKWREKLSPKISSSQFLMGELYMEEQNRAEAVKWYRKAALTGNLNAQSRLTELDETW